jgi:hypothetical protein
MIRPTLVFPELTWMMMKIRTIAAPERKSRHQCPSGDMRPQTRNATNIFISKDSYLERLLCKVTLMC